MKNISCRFIADLLILCLLGGCTSSPKGVGAQKSIGSHKLTQEQMLADYDTMWNDIEENYPLMGVAKRTVGIDPAEIKAEYREKVAGVRSDKAFFDLLTSCINTFHGTGHLCIFDEKNYKAVMSVYQKLDYPQCKCLYQVLNNPASKTFYLYTPEDIYAEAEQQATQNGGSGNTSTKIIEKDQIAYLGIKSFGSELVSVDAKKISDFFAETKNVGNCIIDIRGNGGGDTNYWMKNLVEPNIDHDITVTNFELVKSETARQYLSLVQKLQPIQKFKKLPNTNADDFAQMKYFTQNDMTLKSKNGKKAFSGKFYLLTDGHVYSSAEAFASFCKESGFATIVGTVTNGDGVGIDPLLFVLPNSGIVLRFSAALGLNPDGSSNEEFGTTPDYPSSKAEDALEDCICLIQTGKES